MEPQVSIIYVNYRTAELTARSIESVKEKCVGCSYEVIVVDNDSGDDIEQRLACYGGEIKLIKSPENLGFGRANNLGAQGAKGKYIFYLNTDTELLNDAVAMMSNYMDKNEEVGGVGANLYTADGHANQSFLYCHTFWSEFKGYMPQCLKRGQRDIKKWFNVTENALNIEGYISGAAVMVRREWVEKWGGFNSAFFMYYEDMELSVRIRRSGLKLHNLPWAKIIHLGGSSSGSVSNEDVARRYGMLSNAKYTYYNIVYGRRYSRAVFLMNRFFHWFYSIFGSPKNRALHRLLIREQKIENRKK